MKKRIIPFGKYKSERLMNVPIGYLLWILENINDGPNTIWKKYAEVEIKRRKGQERRARIKKRKLANKARTEQRITESAPILDIPLEDCPF